MIPNGKRSPKAEYQKENLSYPEVILFYFNPNRFHVICNFFHFIGFNNF